MNNFIEKSKLFGEQLNCILELIKPLKPGRGLQLSKDSDPSIGIVLTKCKPLVLTIDDIEQYFNELLVKTNIQYNVSEYGPYIFIGRAHDADSLNAQRKAGWGDRRAR